jgi:hypothetical protein
MPKFDASSIEVIAYDFTSWGVNEQGDVPEPSRDQVNKMMAIVQTAFRELGIGDEKDDLGTPEAITRAMKSIEDDDVFEQLTAKLIVAIADVCSGHPSKEALEALPYRIFMGFFGYLMGEIMSPEVSRPGMTTSQKGRLRSA